MEPHAEGLAAAQLLSQLIALPTHHPGPDGGSGSERAFCDALVPLLLPHNPDELVIVDVPRAAGGAGAYLFARWGRPDTLINAHIDTVPANTGWTRDPWTAAIVDGRVYGLGACDIKGAVAAIITALGRGRPRMTGLLFSGDEEHGTASVQHFLKSPRREQVRHAIVCEPTARHLGIAHRGLLAHRARVAGVGGHSSKADHLPRPLGQLARFAIGLEEVAQRRLGEGAHGMNGLCLNLAQFGGGVAYNVVPSDGELVFSIRPWPGFDRAAWLHELTTLAHSIHPGIEVSTFLEHTPFACGDTAGISRVIGSPIPQQVGLDFWTEAALWEEAEIPAGVMGPGDIKQAHAPDEYVSIDDLKWAVDLYARIMHES